MVKQQAQGLPTLARNQPSRLSYFGSEAADQGRVSLHSISLAGERVSVRSRLFSVVSTRDHEQAKQKSTDNLVLGGN